MEEEPVHLFVKDKAKPRPNSDLLSFNPFPFVKREDQWKDRKDNTEKAQHFCNSGYLK